MSMLITATKIIFSVCRVPFKFLFCFVFFDKLSHSNCIRWTAYLQLHIYENLHSHLILRFLSLFRWGRKNKGRGEGRCQLNKELINIQKFNY